MVARKKGKGGYLLISLRHWFYGYKRINEKMKEFAYLCHGGTSSTAAKILKEKLSEFTYLFYGGTGSTAAKIISKEKKEVIEM